MNTLILPGNSPRHAAWLNEFKDYLTLHTNSGVTTHPYAHWETGEAWADIPTEIARTATHLPKEPYVITAKSIGTAVAVLGTAEGAFKPERLVLLGVPLEGASINKAFFEALRTIQLPVTIVQNSQDPYGSFSSVKEALIKVKEDLTFIEMAGETHDYVDFEEIARLSA